MPIIPDQMFKNYFCPDLMLKVSEGDKKGPVFYHLSVTLNLYEC